MYQNDRGDFGRYWPIWAARLVSLVMSVLATVFIYGAGREATGQPATGLLVASLVALLPQFIIAFRAARSATMLWSRRWGREPLFHCANHPAGLHLAQRPAGRGGDRGGLPKEDQRDCSAGSVGVGAPQRETALGPTPCRPGGAGGSYAGSRSSVDVAQSRGGYCPCAKHH